MMYDACMNDVEAIETNETIILKTVILKARISLRREIRMSKFISMYTQRIQASSDLEEAKFWNDILITEICFIDDCDEIKELQIKLDSTLKD
jgi:hypothetical protein